MFPKYHQQKYLQFYQFDISEFLSSISGEFSEIPANFGKIGDRIIRIIKHAKKLLLFGITGVPVKNDDNSLFNVTMGSFNGADVCELVLLYLLSKIFVVIDSDNIGLYRDDGVAVINNAKDPKFERLRKKHNRYIQNGGLSITIETNLIETDILDLKFNLSTGKY